MEAHNVKDFYIILPSNACPNFHPDNNASNFNVSWENAINLKGVDWKVALVEATIMYPKFTLTTNYGIEYKTQSVAYYKYEQTIDFFEIDKQPEDFQMIGYREDLVSPIDRLGHKNGTWRENFWVRGIDPGENFSYTPLFDNIFPPWDNFSPIEIRAIRKDIRHFQVVFLSIHQFRLTFKEDEFHWLKIDKPVQWSEEFIDRHEFRTGVLKPNESWTEAWNVTFSVEFFTKPLFQKNIVNFKENIHCNRIGELSEKLSKSFPDVLEEVWEEDNRLRLKVKRNVTQLKFLDNMHITLGLATRNYEFPRPKDSIWNFTVRDNYPLHVLFATHSPVYNIGINHLYIYTSICRPINVGGSMVPLLKSVWLDGEKRDYSHGEIINVTLSNPMYIPLASTSINSIEVNIRNDYGKFIPFPEGAVTSLTLHFKRDD